MVRQPSGNLEGLSLRKYHLGRTYDLPSSIAAYLVAQGVAVVEMRSERGSFVPASEDRRGKPPAV